MLEIICITPPPNYGVYQVLQDTIAEHLALIKTGWYFVDWRDGMPDTKWGQFTLLGHSKNRQETINLAWQDYWTKKTEKKVPKS